MPINVLRLHYRGILPGGMVRRVATLPFCGGGTLAPLLGSG